MSYLSCRSDERTPVSANPWKPPSTTATKQKWRCERVHVFFFFTLEHELTTRWWHFSTAFYNLGDPQICRTQVILTAPLENISFLAFSSRSPEFFQCSWQSFYRAPPFSCECLVSQTLTTMILCWWAAVSACACQSFCLSFCGCTEEYIDKQTRSRKDYLESVY